MQLANNATVGNPSATPDSTTVFAVTVTDSKSCSAEDSMTFFVHVLADILQMIQYKEWFH